MAEWWRSLLWVGLAGLVGAGRSEVARVLFWIDRRDGGEVRLAGKPVDFAAPSDAFTSGWNLRASFRNACLTSFSVAVLATPSVV